MIDYVKMDEIKFYRFYKQYDNKLSYNSAMKFVVLLLLSGCIWGVSGWYYDQQHTLQCSQIQNDWDLYQNLHYLWSIVQLHIVDRYTFLTLCPIVCFFQMLLIITMLKFKMFKHSPEDIIFTLIITETFANLSLFSSAVYLSIFSIENPMPESFPAFCIATGVLNCFMTVAQRIYLVYFLLHVIFNVNKSIKQNKWFIRGKFKHIFPLALAGLIVLIAWLLGWIGLSQLGICELTETRDSTIQIQFPILQLGFGTGFAIFSIYTYRYFKSHMPKISALNRRKIQDNILITRFTVGMSIIIGLYAIAKFFLFLNCERENPLPGMLFFATLFNLTRIAEFCFLIAVIFLYKKIGIKVKKMFRNCISKKKNPSSALDHRRMSKTEYLDVIDVGLREKILDILEQDNQIDFLKVTQIMTMLTGVRMAYREYIKAEDSLRVLKNLHYHEEVSFRVDSKWVADYEQEALILPRLSFLDGKVTIFSPQVFKHILAMDNISGVEDSFDLITNSQRLYKLMQNNGGRSGEFFFFSSDNKYILKTVPKIEFQNILQQLPLFYQHFKRYPNTLITKFYGLFKIQHEQIYRTYYMLLMKNISGCQKEQIKRIYDMKGSTDDRRVLKDTKDLEALSIPTSTVYKDLDFIQLQHKMYLTSQQIHEVKSQLKIDTAFLKDLNIIDYSLLVMKIEWPLQPQSLQFWGELQRLPSTNQDQIYYHISLIDVSQKWDISKKSEQWWKKLLGKKDTSAQQPSFYQARFMNLIREITTFEKTQDMRQRETTLRFLRQNFTSSLVEHQMQQFREEQKDPRTLSDQNQVQKRQKISKTLSVD